MSPYNEWIPPERRLRASLSRGVKHFDRSEFFAAYRAFGYAVPVAGNDDVEFVRGLRHAAAAGVKRQRGDEVGAERQARHAKRRLGPYRPHYRDVDVDSVVAAIGGSDH